MRSCTITGIFVALVVGTAAGISGDALALGSEPTGRDKDAKAAEAHAPVAVPQPSELAVQYNRSGNVLWVVRQAVALAVPALVLFTGFSARLRNWAKRIGRRWFFILLVYFLLYSLTDYVLSLPLAFYEGYLRQHAYGMSNQSLGKWLGNSLLELAILLVAGWLLLWVPYLILRKSPRRWWIYTGLLAVPVVIFTMFVTPIWIAPLFNRFGPMKNKHLEARILALAERAGIEGSRVYEVDKSADTKFTNAYVTGFMSTKRIVLWDTLLAKLDTPEVLFVMAHEMGHYVLGHVFQGVLFSCLGVFVALAAVYYLSGHFLRRFGRRFGFDELSDIASLPLLILLVQGVALVLTPLGLAVSRHMEREADRFGLELTQNNHAAAMAFVKLQQDNLGVPRHGLLWTLWRASHPSIADRIEFANSYRPWEQGRPLRYGSLFRKEGGG